MVLAKPLSRILYVDDDASMRELVRTALADQAEFTVVTWQVAGAADVIPVPFDPAELPKLIRSIWSHIDD